jgi:capsular polysaccharide export protein
MFLLTLARTALGPAWNGRAVHTGGALAYKGFVDPPLVDLAARRIGWGRRPSGERAVRLAARDGVPFLLLEDGFIRSVERDDAPLSVVADDRGIYYDCRHPSRLEHLVAQPLEECEERRARALVQAWREERVSKYNHARDHSGWLPGRYVLVCDQTLGDQSVRHGGADAESFRRMLDAALEENPGCKVVLKIHPDVLLRRKRGYLDAAAAAGHPRIHVIAEDCHAASLIAGAEAVYAVTSQMGFEALIWGRRVRCFGMPFYAGWGLTADDCRPPARRAPARLEQLVHAALVRYPRYADPETGERCEVERVLAHVGLQRRMRGRFPPLVHALGFSRWKRPIVKRFLAGSAVVFVRHERQVPAGAAVALWGRDRSGACPQAAQEIAIEDGFLRSVGLGADFTQPLSWVQDDMGLHYDAAGASRLERILAEEHFSEALLARAAGLRAAILAAGITKYNLAAPEGGRPWRRPDAKGRVILVPGQVEDDAALRHGAPGVRRNADLLRAVRAMHPDGYIVYKPHPDVAAGLRAPGPGERDAASWCDEIAPEVPIGTIFDQVDEVHTMTSLAGFEALLRGRPVTCHGLPFYAGWGLTADMIAAPRRSRRLGLDELVAGALILYPSYVSRVTGRFTTPERALEELIAWRSAGGGRPSLGRRLLRPALAHARRLHRCLIHGG